ncbi:hypothetical protein X798_05602 [Onchocerca flexuosa]|uniref:Uncharacterized protein n=2 Tax=Onchocerca flexuosa TaxID=387005 RepID=A0A183I3F3_9BILA|nr:hypothetical protein X798_05602 [Onchocerca flexuosa]VDP16247.1 unnamed protein product [Onchocerca flexuosa]
MFMRVERRKARCDDGDIVDPESGEEPFIDDHEAQLATAIKLCHIALIHATAAVIVTATAAVQFGNQTVCKCSKQLQQHA